jgi:S1-C subfamily serine protease
MLCLLACAAAFGGTKPGTLSQTFKRVDDAVVVVRTNERVVSRNDGHQDVRTAGLGSGVLIGKDGKVLTAAHVVQTADAVAVEFASGTLVRARVVASDPAADVALLQLESVPSGATVATLGDSDKTEVGDEIFVVGAPFGIGHTLTVGHVSARRRANTTFADMEGIELFQTDAAINQGNSGGPMFNLAGEVIGVVSRILSRSGGSEGLGFVVTSNLSRHLLLAEPTIWTGLEGYLVSGDMAQALNLPGVRAGLLVQRIAHQSPAERLGLRGGHLPALVAGEQLILGGDIVLAVEGVALEAPNAYDTIRRRLIAARADNSQIQLLVLRGGVTLELTGPAASTD